jgi:trigger factor
MGLGEGLEGYLRMINQSEEDYRESLRSEASKLALRNLVLSEVIKQEGIEATDDDIEEHIKQLVGVDENGEILESAAELANMLRFGGGRSLVVSQVLSSKAVDFLVALARGEEPPSPAAKSESSAAEATNTDEVSISSVDAIDNSETEEKLE